MKAIFGDLVKGGGYGVVFILLCSILDYAMNKI